MGVGGGDCEGGFGVRIDGSMYCRWKGWEWICYEGCVLGDIGYT